MSVLFMEHLFFWQDMDAIFGEESDVSRDDNNNDFMQERH
jgi:hypothetical protein